MVLILVAFSLGLTVAVAVYVIYPLVRRKANGRSASELKLTRESYYAQIEELKKRHAEGELDKASFNRQTGELKLSAAKLLRDEEQILKSEIEQQRLESEILKVRDAEE